MKVSDALRVLNGAPPASAGRAAFALACGFTPLHLRTLLAAHLQVRVHQRHVEVETGLYGDLLGTLETLQATPPEGVAVVLEWSDLDPRLGLRDLGGWRPEDVHDVVAGAERRA